MALFTRYTDRDLELLLSLGFTAKLSRNGRYISVDEPGIGRGASLLLLPSPEKSSSFQFFGQVGSLRSVVRTVDNKFINPPSLELSETPTALCVHADKNGRVSFSDLRAGPSARYLYNHNTSFDLHVLEVASGKPIDSCEPLEIRKAVIEASLVLGLRFRLRSVHGRVLRRSKKNKNVLQDGDKSELAESFSKELVFEPIRRGKHIMLQDVDTEKILSIVPGADGKTRLIDAKLAAIGSSGAHLIFEGARDHWSWVHLGIPVDEGENIEWLMAGARGRLETRRHKRPWETFRMEYVEQSRTRALDSLPKHAIVVKAEKASLAKVRAAVQADVQKARASSAASQTPKRTNNNANKGGFNHAKALAGLSEPEPQPEIAPPASTSNGNTPSSTTASASAVPARVAASSAAPTEGGSSLPRTAQNRKLTKREKRKKKKKALGGNQNSNASASAAASSGSKSKSKRKPASSGSSTRTETDSTTSSGASPSDENSSVEQNSVVPSSSSSSGSSAGSGGLCAACGQAITGPYTSAMGKNFHHGCLVCAKCRIPLTGSGKLRTHQGLPHCVRCYKNHCAPRCARCTQPIMDTVITAMEKTWHRECLTCTWCRKPLGDTFWIYANKPREPHCNECVGAQAGSTNNNRRAVNLPGFGPRNTQPGMGSNAFGAPSQIAGGGARLHMRPSRPGGGF